MTETARTTGKSLQVAHYNNYWSTTAAVRIEVARIQMILRLDFLLQLDFTKVFFVMAVNSISDGRGIHNGP